MALAIFPFLLFLVGLVMMLTSPAPARWYEPARAALWIGLAGITVVLLHYTVHIG